MSKPQDVRVLFDAAVERFGRVHILVNNAGIILYKRLDQTTDDEFDRLFAVNVKGVFNALREASRRLEDGGRIINFSSSTTRLMLPTYARLRDQGGRRAIDADLRQGGRSARHHGQRRLARADQHGVVHRGQERSGHPTHRRWPRSDGSANRKTSPTSCCSWRVTRPVGSPRRTLGPTAGWPDQVP